MNCCVGKLYRSYLLKNLLRYPIYVNKVYIHLLPALPFGGGG